MATVAQNVTRFRKELGLSQASLAKAVGIHQNAIHQLEKGVTQKPKYLPEIATVLGKRLSEIDENYAGPEDIALVSRAEVAPGERNLPLYGSVDLGGVGMAKSSEPVDYVRRPASLAQVKDGYGIIVSTDSMVPEFQIGDVALVNPHLPVENGDTCIFFGEDKGRSVFLIRSLVRRTETHWTVEQWNPRRRATLPRRAWAECQLIVGRYNRRR